MIFKFWSVFDELDESEKKALLEFFTGSDRVPIGGLGRLKPRIQSSGPDSDRLPTGIIKTGNISVSRSNSNETYRQEKLLKLKILGYCFSLHFH